MKKYGNVDIPEEDFKDENVMISLELYKKVVAERDQLKAENENLIKRATLDNLEIAEKIIQNQRLRSRIDALRDALIRIDTMSDGSRSCGHHYGHDGHSKACLALSQDDQEAAK